MRIGTQLRRRHGQGMTEYIVIVGLIAMLLIAAVTRYKEQVRVTIEGSARATDDISDRMDDGLTANNPTGGDIPGLPPNAQPVGPGVNGGTVYSAPNGDRYTVLNGTASPGGRVIGEN